MEGAFDTATSSGARLPWIGALAVAVLVMAALGARLGAARDDAGSRRARESTDGLPFNASRYILLG